MKQMTRDELAFHINDRNESFRVEIKGRLCRGNAPSIAEAVRTAEPTIAGRAVVVDIEGLTGIDAFGRSLLRDWHDAGVQITATSHSARLLVRSVTGEPPFLGGGATALKKWWSWATRFIPFLALLFPALGIAANLAPQTLAAWERYVESEKLTMERRVSAGKAFLLVDEAPERLAKLRAGEVVFSPGAPRNLTRVPGGLIHDWVGAVFVPGVELADVLAVVSDFASYKNYYKPTVVDSKVIASTDIGGRFSMLLLNQSLLMGTAFDTDYESRYVRVSPQQAYSISRTTRVQEIADYGAPAQHLLPEGRGTGFIWRLFSITRFLQRDGGVYIEIEAIGLSRDVPISLRWLVEPIVARVARGSLNTALQQTGQAASSYVEAARPGRRGRLSVAFRRD